MEVSLAGQALFLAGALLLGAAVGLLYDAFRVLRVRIPFKPLGGLLDLLFWLVVTAALFVYTLTAGNGEVRIYMVLAVLGGAAAYFLLLSRWALKAGYFFADLIAMLCRIATLPLALAARLTKKIGKSAKKCFHYRHKWYKIKSHVREMEELWRRERTGLGGQHENTKGIHFDQAGGAGAARQRGHQSAEPAQSDPAGPGRSGADTSPGDRPAADQRRSGRRHRKQRRSRTSGRHRPE